MTALAAERFGFTPRKVKGLDLKMKGGVKIYKGAFVVMTGGYVEPATSGTGLKPVGKASDTVDNTAGSDGDLTCHIEFPSEKTLMPLIGDSSHTFAQANVGGKAWMEDDQTVTTVSTGASVAGTVWDFSSRNSVQTVWVELESGADEDLEARVETLETDLAGIGVVPNIQKGSGALSSGVLTVNTGVTITSSSRIFAQRSLAGGTPGVELRALAADRTNGAPGTGVFKVRSYDSSGVAATSDTSTVEWLIVG